MKTAKTNKELLLLIKKDDKVAFYNLYERYSKKLYAFVLKYLKQDCDAEEIVQEVFVKIWESRSKIDVDSSFDSFLFTIGYNATISLFRKRLNQKKYLDHIKSIQYIDNAANFIEEIELNELNQRVELLLNELTPRQKEIFQLSRSEGLSHSEIANKLNITVNTVKKHMTNSLVFLKKNIYMVLIMSCVCFYLLLG